MRGETNLSHLIRGMKPQLQAGNYVFCTVPAEQVPDDLAPLGLFREAEGVTLILPQSQADQRSLPYDFVAAWITLTIHSSLEAVGLTAAIAQALAHADISCNVVAAYYHDHLFVGVQDAQRAIDILTGMSRGEPMPD